MRSGIRRYAAAAVQCGDGASAANVRELAGARGPRAGCGRLAKALACAAWTRVRGWVTGTVLALGTEGKQTMKPVEAIC